MNKQQSQITELKQFNMTLKGRLIFPLLLLTFTSVLFYIAIAHQQLFDFENANNILFNIVCFLFLILTFYVLFLVPREVYIDSQKLIIKYPIDSIKSSSAIELSRVKYFKIQSLIRVPGFLLSLYLTNDQFDKNVVKINLVFNIKNNDLDKLINKLKSVNIKQK